MSNSVSVLPSSHSSVSDIEDSSPIPPLVLLVNNEKDEELKMNIPPSLLVPPRMFPALRGPIRSDGRMRTTNKTWSSYK